jgi:hypothetical protein
MVRVEAIRLEKEQRFCRGKRPTDLVPSISSTGGCSVLGRGRLKLAGQASRAWSKGRGLTHV